MGYKNLEENLGNDAKEIFSLLKESREDSNKYHTLTDSLKEVLDILIFNRPKSELDINLVKEFKFYVNEEVELLANYKTTKLNDHDFKGYHKLIHALDKLVKIDRHLVFLLK